MGGATKRERALEGAEARRVCPHFTRVHADQWEELRARRAVNAASHGAARLERYLTENMEEAADVSKDAYRCLSCPFVGVREDVACPREEDEDDCSFMAHSILHNHLIALMPSKNQAFCSRCMDFIYPVVEAAEPNAALVLRTKKKRPRVGPSTLLGISVPRLLLRGLVNMGNTCFLNAVLQAFAHNRMLQDYFFVARTHDTVICQQRRRLRAAEPSARPSVCLGCELAAFMGSLIPPLDGSGGVTDRAASTSPVVPHGILEALWTVFPSFIGTEQHDAHELLIALLGGLHSHTHPRVFVQDGRSPRFTPRGRSLCDCPVHQHFSGVLRSELECAECGTVSHKFDPFLDISLSLDDLVASSDQDSSTISLDTLLRKFTADEELRDVNQVYCPRCSKYRTAVKRLCIRTLPNVLAFHIRRLDFYKQRKLGAFVQFPLKALDMQKFTVPPAEAPDAEVDSLRASIPMLQLDMFSGTNTGPYDLAAVINHHGESVDGGHYTTFVADDHNARLASSKKRNQWFLVDDDQVSPATEDQVRESQAYILIYVRRRPVGLTVA